MRTETKVHGGLALSIASVLALGSQVAIANAPGGPPTPANKAIASGSTLAVFSPQEGPVQLLSATLRTSKPTDLMIHTSLECSILTKLTTGPDEQLAAPPAPGSTPITDTAKARANIQGWIEIDDDPVHDGPTDPNERVVPIESSSQPPQDPAESGSGTVDPATEDAADVPTPDDSATYCNRTYERTVTDRENPLDGIDQETDYIDTKSANAFNWVLLNAGSGVHHVRLMGEITAGDPMSCPKDSTVPVLVDDPEAEGDENDGCTSGFVGNRTMIIEPTKMANDAIIGPNAQS